MCVCVCVCVCVCWGDKCKFVSDEKYRDKCTNCAFDGNSCGCYLCWWIRVFNVDVCNVRVCVSVIERETNIECVCMCVCVFKRERVCICVCVCVCVCVSCVCVCLSTLHACFLNSKASPNLDCHLFSYRQSDIFQSDGRAWPVPRTNWIRRLQSH